MPQTRELIRIDSDLLAHANVLLGDLGQDQHGPERLWNWHTIGAVDLPAPT